MKNSVLFLLLVSFMCTLSGLSCRSSNGQKNEDLVKSDRTAGQEEDEYGGSTDEEPEEEQSAAASASSTRGKSSISSAAPRINPPVL